MKYKSRDFCLNEENYSKEKILCDWFQYSQDHMDAAIFLRSSEKLEFLDSTAILIHYGFELFFKFCLLFQDDEFQGIHDLLDLCKKVFFIKINGKDKVLFAQIDKMFHSRYPITINDRANSNEKSMLLDVGEVDTKIIEDAIKLYNKFYSSLPKLLIEIIAKADPCEKGSRILMRKKEI